MPQHRANATTPVTPTAAWPFRNATGKAIVRIMRPHQWVKNSLVAAPFLLAHKPLAIWDILTLAYTFLAFCFTSSAVYILNDYADRQADRCHPTKKNRPFASGALPAAAAWFLIPACLALSYAIIHQLAEPESAMIMLLLYALITTAYSFGLKKVPLLDVMTLSGLYTWRILTGGIVLGITISPWLMTFSMFFFLSLALVKRVAELRDASKLSADSLKLPGRSYFTDDLTTLNSLGIGCGLLSCLVFALYLNSPQVVPLYPHPQWLWVVTILLFYWLARVWLIAGRGQMDQDPIVFALRDKGSYGIFSAIMFFLAIASDWLPT